MEAEILLETGIATLIAVLGGAIAMAAAGSEPAAHQRRLAALVSLAAGALLAVTLITILPEAHEHLSLIGLFLAAVSGYGLYYLIGRYVFPICPACASTSAISDYDPAHVHSASCSHDHGSKSKPRTNFRNIATVLGVVVAAHAAIDGIAIAAGQPNNSPADPAVLASMAQTLPLLFALSLHKLPEGLALTALLMSSGFRRSQAFLLTTGIEMATLLGGALGVLLRDMASPVLLSAVMAHVGGGFLYLVFQALKGETGEHSPVQAAVFPRQFVYGAIGFGFVSLVLWLVHLLPVTR